RLNIYPAVFIRVGDQKRHTATQKSTNCPFYNENFQFEFQEAPQILFDKVIEIKVFHRRTLAFLMTHIGTFKIDISTVYNQPGTNHRFYQKWAPLTDPADTRSGIKGYVKASLSVLMKGDAMSMASLLPTSTSGASEDIEKNLLLPRGMASERPWARFRVRIYRAEGLPTMDSGLMAKMSKVTDRTVFIDPYVQVTFAGQQGETTVASVTSCPVWNEEINFIEQFPPLAQRIRVQILDDAKMGDIALATHFLDLQQISDPTRNGFNPTCGPCWVNLYGSPQNSTLGDVHQALNQGLGEGIFYRGRILLALSVEVYTSPSGVTADIGTAALGKVPSSSFFSIQLDVFLNIYFAYLPESVTSCRSQIFLLLFRPQGFLGEREDFLLFASLFEFTMIDPSVGTKPLTFELSIGMNKGVEDIMDLGVGQRRLGVCVCLCTLPMVKPMPRVVYHDMVVMAWWGKYCTNTTHFLSFCLPLRSYQCLPLQPPSLKQKPCLFVWSQFEDHSFRLHQANWLSLNSTPTPTPHSLQPQNTIPDAFLWLLSGSKRLAYVRIPAHSIFFSLVEEQKGRDCGQVTTLYMKSPGSSASEIFAKLEVYLWLGLAKYSKVATNSLPEEFLPVYEEEEEELRRLVPAGKRTLPVSLSCQGEFFQLRCHLYQGRGLMAADDNGLSDPFAKVLFSTQCQVTRMLSDTLSPAWCECLLFDQVLLEGTREELERDPPLIIINIFDYDSMGSPKPLGRAFAEPEFKPVEQFYKKPSLRFFDINLGRAPAGELLAAFELIELDYSGLGEVTPVNQSTIRQIFLEQKSTATQIIRPVLKTFRIEVLFWGLRELKRVQLFEVERPLVRVECAGRQLESEEIESYKVHPNFKELELPEQAYLHPPLTLFVVEHRAFGRLALVGSHVVQSLMYYAPPELGGREEEEEEEPKQKGKSYQRSKKEELEEEMPEKEELDWWSKYYASLDEMERKVRLRLRLNHDSPSVCVAQMYGGDLESEFSQFQDWLQIFPLYKGRSCAEDEEDDDEERVMGKYKGSFLVYPINAEDTEDTKCQITEGIPKNSPIKVLVRVYVVKATSLAPTDPNGKADPYLVIKVGQQSLDTKDRYIPKQLNPTFGEVFELTVSFPLETELAVTVMDHDLVGSDDVIGETRVDLENRFYSRHRACCGLALHYDTDGYNMWRDAKKPTTILAELCRENSIPSPEYRATEKNQPSPEENAEMEEHAALSVLQRWGEMREFLPGALPLVAEHVEIRSLLNQDKPGLPQGYLHMWVDMFPNDVPAPPPVDIKPRLPEQYELRVIIWNTDDVFLDDVNPFTGDPSSDIYVKGWIKGLEGNKQETDVHFNSLTGEGNFNWRFLFRFDYLPTEKEVVYKKKESFFSLEESEFRQPAVLTLQVWDYDRIAANDFLGSIELRLNDMVRPAKSSAQCSIDMAKDRASPRFSILRAKKMKGWWPLTRLKTGKVEAELQLVTLEQAEANPVGRARKEPEPLDKPNRPTTSFNWFVNPMKTFIFLIWRKFKKFIIAVVILAILAVFLALLVYTLPQQISALIVNG
uniref:Fer-1 like family member 4 n=1 Tax=Scophthalmus maximus TaxID=52904 RepID=A0A8D3D626_SCOMX